MNIYLDIDGVLLTKDRKPAPFVREFLAYILDYYPDSTYWLTTHCQGDSDVTLQHVGHLFDVETVVMMRKIKPTQWDMTKTEAIDLSKPFLWFDDNLFSGERETLLKHGVLDNWIGVDLRANPDQLKVFLDSFPVPINLTK